MGKTIKCTLKDTNWNEHGRAMFVGTHRRVLVQQIQADTRLLQALNIMDYSLLVGIHRGYEGELSDDVRA